MSGSRIRPVTDILALKNVMHIFQHGKSDQLLTWKERHTINTNKIKTGNIQDGAEVVRDLMRMKKEKALNASEKKMLDDAHEFLLSELEVIKGITEKQIKVSVKNLFLTIFEYTFSKNMSTLHFI